MDRADERGNRNDLKLVLALYDKTGRFAGGWEKTVQVSLPGETTEPRQPPAVKITSTFELGSGSYLIRLLVRDSDDHLMATHELAVQVP
jgi:hypothetical protein